MLLRLCILLAFLLPSAQPTRARLLVLGDSLTVGLFASSEEETYKQQLATVLHAELTSAYAANLLGIEAIWAAWEGEADVIVLEIGLNDVLGFGPKPLPESEWPAHYGALIESLKASGARVIATTLFSGLHPLHEDYARLLRYNGYIREQAARHGVPLADIFRATDRCPACLSRPEEPSVFPPLYHGDNFHPSDRGHAIMAHTIAGAISNTVYLPIIMQQTAPYPPP